MIEAGRDTAANGASAVVASRRGRGIPLFLQLFGNRRELVTYLVGRLLHRDPEALVDRYLMRLVG